MGPGGRRVFTGRVEAFDDAVGIGTLGSDDGAQIPFHCTAIADGTRSISPGTRVAFTTRPAHGGGREGWDLVAL